MNRPQFVFHLNLRDPAQCRAVCILKAGDLDATQKELRKVLKEELSKIQVTAAPAEPKPKKPVPKSTLDFFSALQLDEPE